MKQRPRVNRLQKSFRLAHWFCTTGCEHADMQCISEENDDNKNGVRDSEEFQESNDDNDRESNNDNDKKYCDNDKCYKNRETMQELSEDWNDWEEPFLPNCNYVEAGTRCTGTEDEDSWLDTEQLNTTTTN